MDVQVTQTDEKWLHRITLKQGEVNDGEITAFINQWLEDETEIYGKRLMLEASDPKEKEVYFVFNANEDLTQDFTLYLEGWNRGLDVAGIDLSGIFPQ